MDTLQWLENGDWAKHSGRPGRQNIEEFVADILSRRTKKASKKATKLRKLDSRQRHKLRIAMKKLRYASDFFGHLFCGRKARKRLSSFRVHLKDLRDRLGALNDITVHQRMAPQLAAERRPTVAPRRAFAAGVVSGHEQSELKPQLRAAYKDASKFAKIRAFWT